MNNLVTRIGMGAALAATALAVAAPADAQRFRGRYNRGGDVAGAALLGGVVGLGIGAAIAGNRGGYGPGYYGGGYGGYYGPAYYPQPVYYAPPVVYRQRFVRPRFVGRPYGFRGGYPRPVVRYRGW